GSWCTVVGQLYSLAVLERCWWRQHDALTVTQTAAHLAVTTDSLSQCDTAAFYFAVGVHEHHTCGAIRLHCFSRHEDAGCQRRGPHGLRIQEGDAHTHVGHDTRVPLFDGDAHFDGGLTAVCRRDDGDHRTGDLPCRIGV